MVDGVSLQPHEAASLVTIGIAEIAGQHQQHQAVCPEFTPSAAGQGFVEYGSRLAAMLMRVHARQGRNITAAQEVLRRARREVSQFVAADQANEAALRWGRR
ncbi:hypothetical protein ACUY3K_03430 [Corynebacterium uberis]|uniref:hypothetical protein n=1 Tax=Corynebacterium TaxID=1716 RepID=UPI001D0A9C7C|nr:MULTISPECIES: hypothetical protein [Corynebacterium]MCZ9309357.1 hypothetical protein [Corynebacterium sp. c6VSa_13]UDL72906.1 hypothetical protein LH391_07230 [Corynebacterium uberis]UDL76217.1 hypothetical protein LH393_02165 [Corynebacterium uberis]UDL78429.1 hypothetical protein LH394_02155 [Corynebacterium uberis]UDL80712.1 hypothetical protein LH392_02585 [Corynebacterium uberis]